MAHPAPVHVLDEPSKSWTDGMGHPFWTGGGSSITWTGQGLGHHKSVPKMIGGHTHSRVAGGCNGMTHHTWTGADEPWRPMPFRVSFVWYFLEHAVSYFTSSHSPPHLSVTFSTAVSPARCLLLYLRQPMSSLQVPTPAGYTSIIIIALFHPFFHLVPHFPTLAITWWHNTPPIKLTWALLTRISSVSWHQHITACLAFLPQLICNHVHINTLSCIQTPVQLHCTAGTWSVYAWGISIRDIDCIISCGKKASAGCDVLVQETEDMGVRRPCELDWRSVMSPSYARWGNGN